MPSVPFRRPVLRLLRQALAAGCVALVLMLGWLAVDDGAHAALHAAADPVKPCASSGCAHDDHGPAGAVPGESSPGEPCGSPGCVIAQFLAGATDPLALLALVLLGAVTRVVARWRVVESSRARAVFAWAAPSCGPPAAA